MIRQIADLLDEWMPMVAGAPLHDDPLAPISAHARDLIAERGDETPIDWVHRDDRYVEKLATPDVSVADLIGDVDPVKVAEGRSLADEHTIHFGLIPRTHRGVFCINELPDLTEKVQVGLFNVMEERDVQVKGYRIRLPVDVLVVASANPEDYTSRGRIITPLKDRYAAQIRTPLPAHARARAAGGAPGGGAPLGGGDRDGGARLHGGGGGAHDLRGARQPGRQPGLRGLGAHDHRELRDAARQRAAPGAASRGGAGGAARLRSRRPGELHQRQDRARVRGRRPQ